MVQNLTWSGVYLRNTLSSAILQRVLKLVLLTATVPDVYVATMNTILSDSYDYLVENLNHMKSLKLKDRQGKNSVDCCDVILVDAERLESSGAFKTEQLGCIIHIFEDTSDSRFRLWETEKYNEVMDFIKKLCVCDEDVMKPDDIINYGSLG